MKSVPSGLRVGKLCTVYKDCSAHGRPASLVAPTFPISFLAVSRLPTAPPALSLPHHRAGGLFLSLWAGSDPASAQGQGCEGNVGLGHSQVQLTVFLRPRRRAQLRGTVVSSTLIPPSHLVTGLQEQALPQHSDCNRHLLHGI